MRIALISEHASPLACLGSVDAGGQNVYVREVALSLAGRGHSVDVVTRRDSPGLPDIVALAPGARVVHVDAGPACFVAKEAMLGHMPEFSANWLRIVEHGDCGPAYDIAHANFFMSGLVAMRAKAALGLPMAMTFHALGHVRRKHQGMNDGFPPERVEIERRIVATADRVIAECPQDEADLVQLYGASPRSISTVPCGVDLEEFAPCDRTEARRALGIGAGEFVVLQLGRMVPRKGIDNVIRAVALLDDPRDVRLVVVGGDDSPLDGGRLSPERARLGAVATECGVDAQVDFVGHQPRAKLATYYAACDVFVTTPWYEPFGITPLEAMACERAVIGSEVGGIAHTVVDGETGFLVRPRDPLALAERLARLRADPALARQMGRRGARRVRARFTWSRVAERLEAVYLDVLARARSRSGTTAPGRGAMVPANAAQRIASA